MPQPMVPRHPLPPSAESDAPAFDALVRAHYARLCNFAARLVRSRETAEDIVQDVFGRLWQGRDRLDVHDPLPYLYQAVRNRAIMHARRSRVHDRWWETQAAEPEPSAPSAAEEIECTDLAEALARAIESLPERCRLVFTMSREQDLTYSQIARALDISVKTVETQMGRALKVLRSRLAGYIAR